MDRDVDSLRLSFAQLKNVKCWKCRKMGHYQCDCPESSEALGMKVSREDRSRDVHKMTPTILFRDNQCKYCGHYAMFVGKKAEDGNQRHSKRQDAANSVV